MTSCQRLPDGQYSPGSVPVPAELGTLQWLCREFRKDLLDLTQHSGTQSSHLGGELSLVELLAVLFFRILRLDPSNPGWSARDRAFLRANGFALAHLGTRVLRTETAVVAAVALVKARLGLF